MRISPDLLSDALAVKYEFYVVFGVTEGICLVHDAENLGVGIAEKLERLVKRMRAGVTEITGVH